MTHTPIGHVTHYFEHLHVAVLALDAAIHVGDWVHITGHTTDFAQQVTSLQINHLPVAEAAPGADVALKVIERVRAHDVVYAISAEEARDFESQRPVEHF